MRSLSTAVTLGVLVILPSFVYAALDQDLSAGSRGEDVKVLQQFLGQFNEFYPEKITSGYFGRLTEAAVKRYQENRQIAPARGYVGVKTRSQINQEMGVSPGQATGENQSSVGVLLQKIEELKRQLALITGGGSSGTLKGATTTPPSPAVATSTPPEIAATTSPVLVTSDTVTIAGNSVNPFGESAKIGDMSFTNNSAAPAILFHVKMTMEEAMNAPHSRGQTFKLSLRNGTTTYDGILEKKNVTLRQQDAIIGQYNSQLLTFYAGLTLAPGETKTLSLWAELLVGPFYSGVLRFTSNSVITIPVLTSVGNGVISLSD